MGKLKRFNLSRIKEEYDIEFFFETGTWRGDGVNYALKTGFKKIVSSEIIPSVAEMAQKRFSNESNVEIIIGNSIEIMESRLDTLPGNCLFWLDAHFPGAEEKLNDYNTTDDENVRLPLKREIELIKEKRKGYKDVLLIDDLRIYEAGPYKSGNLPESILPPGIRNIDFVYTAFADTHIIKKSYREQGYLMVFPKHHKKYTPDIISRIKNTIRQVFKKGIY